MLFRIQLLVVSCVLSLLPAAFAGAIPPNVKCSGCQGIVSKDAKYFCGDERLGPAELPKTVPISTMLVNYDRLGGLCAKEFLQQYINATTGHYTYPPGPGFQFSTTGQPIDGNQTLVVGSMLDRFGAESGRYFSPASTPFGQRALPPSSLNNPKEGSPVADYHVYRVERSFVVLAGEIAPWFGQSGQGTQYFSPTKNAKALVDEGFLSRV
ncbi:hypothetical protein DFH08DRAFT_1089552 [Mycena albidolilacea]|uniref:TNT domain-containing protein n=1 Tax=Mycena albidolilacea TaxID=1033008 RepID=A0AAD7E8R2_9AGAR|nr:hypothetical protein DFH08DRAFT_1089552 [Mycena albidolilacea]